MKVKIILIPIIVLIGVLVLIFIIFIGYKKYKSGFNETEQFGEEKVEDKSTFSGGNELLKTVCKTAAEDYPEWTSSTGIVVWENAGDDRNIYYRLAPEIPGMGFTAPGEISAKLVDMDLFDPSVIGYATINQDNISKIGFFDMGIGQESSGQEVTKQVVIDEPDLADKTSFSRNSVIYQKENINILDVSFINEKEFLLLYNEIDKEAQTYLKYKNTADGTEETLSELGSSWFNKEEAPRSSIKLSVSPKGNYAYLTGRSAGKDLAELKVFDLSTKKQIGKITGGIYPVWVGDTHILYAVKNKGVYLLEAGENGNSYEVASLDSAAQDLTFNPANGGMVAYDIEDPSKPGVNVISCQDFKNLASYQDGWVEAFADKDTLVITSDNPTLRGSGFWRFNTQWTLVLSEGKKTNTYSSRSALTTAWSRY
ncbi:MAG: hypothetical protein ABII72_01540 [Parcubacteria group bacterium]